MEIHIAVICYVVAILATAILAGYFFREYLNKKLRASLAWAVGLFLITLALFTDLIVELFGEIAVGTLGLGIALMIVVFALSLLYYGTSLLFFSPGSFFREKFSILIICILGIYFILLLMRYQAGEFREIALTWVNALAMSPILFVIGFLFYRVSRRLNSNDPRRRTILLVSAGWFFITGNSVTRQFLGGNQYLDSIIHLFVAIGWVLVLYGMILGKATKT